MYKIYSIELTISLKRADSRSRKHQYIIIKEYHVLAGPTVASSDCRIFSRMTRGVLMALAAVVLVLEGLLLFSLLLSARPDPSIDTALSVKR
jgi:hypothetical protein